MTTARQLANLRQNRGRPPKELEREARRIRKGALDREFRRLFALAELDVWLRGFADGEVPRSLFWELVNKGPDHLVKGGLKMLNGMGRERGDAFLDRMIEDENARIDRFDLIGKSGLPEAKRPPSQSEESPHDQ